MNLALWIPVILVAVPAAVGALVCWRLPRRSRRALLAGTLLALLLGEAGLRVAGVAHPTRASWIEPLTGAQGDAPAYWPDGELVYTYPDDPRGYFDGRGQVVGHINALGYRGELRPKARRPETFRIAVLGDSFTLGIGVRDEDTLPAQLERALDLPQVEVLNFGVSASDTPEQMRYLRDYVLSFEPDLVLLVFFLNDAERAPTMEYLTRPRALISLRRHSFLLNGLVGLLERALTRDQMRRHYLDGYRADSPGWLRVQDELRAARALLAERGVGFALAVHPILVDLDGSDYPFEDIHTRVLEFCRTSGIPAADLHAALEGRRARELWVHENDQHPNERAHAASAAFLVRFLRTSGLVH